ncbi:MAG: rhodanese-like domain-containing protein [Flaviramulus sp.]|nr:rhodanese-like domain-containing protein [Flaviramulus sp.]
MKYILMMSIFSFLFGCNAQQFDKIINLNNDAFKTEIDSNKVTLVDVRTPIEFKSGHIKNAININFFDREQFITSFNKLDKEAPVYLYCRSGNRSLKAAKRLDSLGFKKIYNLKGGYMNWN